MSNQNKIDDGVSNEQIVIRHSRQDRLSGLTGPISGARIRDQALVELDDLFANAGLIQHLLQSNTFFQGKIGFYKHILSKIYQSAGINPQSVKYISREEELGKGNRSEQPPLERITLLPIVESEDALNRLVAVALRKVRPVWVVAPLFSIQKHLLIAFSNFFVAGTAEELKTLSDIFQLEVDDLDLSKYSLGTQGVLITDFEGLNVNNTLSITVLPLNFPNARLARRVSNSERNF